MTDINDKIVELIDFNELVGLLRALVRIKSPFFQEQEIVEYVFDWFEREGLSPEYHYVEEARHTGFKGNNVIVRIKGSHEIPGLYLNAHVDTVLETGGWTRNPYEGKIEGDRLYGLGALDMKGGLAASMIAIKALAKSKLPLRGDLLFSAVVDEEGPFQLGTDAVIKDGMLQGFGVAVVPEPSAPFSRGLAKFPCLCLGARGGHKYYLVAKGKAAHGAEPEKGINAIEDAAKAVLALSRMKIDSDPKLGSGSICVLKIQGGEAPLSVPEHCLVEVFQHTVRGETADVIRERLRDLLDSVDFKGEVTVQFREPLRPGVSFEPYVTEESEPVTTLFIQAVREVCGAQPQIGYCPTVGDFNYIATIARIPTLVFGPDGGNYHMGDEYVSLPTVYDTARILLAFMVRYLG